MYPEELAHLLRESYKGLQALPAYVVSHIRDAAPAIVILLPSGLLATALWSYQNARLSAALIEVDRASRPDAVPSPITLDKRLDLQKDLLQRVASGLIIPSSFQHEGVHRGFTRAGGASGGDRDAA